MARILSVLFLYHKIWAGLQHVASLPNYRVGWGGLGSQPTHFICCFLTPTCLTSLPEKFTSLCNVLWWWDSQHCTSFQTYERGCDSPFHLCNLLWRWDTEHCAWINRYDAKRVSLHLFKMKMGQSEQDSWFIDFIDCLLTPYFTGPRYLYSMVAIRLSV